MKVAVVTPARAVDDQLFEAVSSAVVDLAGVDDEGQVIVVIDGPMSERADELRALGPVRVEALGTQKGTPFALNRGVELAGTPFIARLDADDIAEPTRLQAAMAHLEANPDLVAVGCSATLVDGQGRRMGDHDVPVGRELVTRTLLQRNAFIHSSMLYRGDAVRQVGGYSEACNRMQDYDLFLRLRCVGPMDNLPDRLIRYRVHDTMSSKVTSPYGPAMRQVLRSRHRLWRHLGGSPLDEAQAQVAWSGAQVLRYHGLRQAGYMKGVSA